jgi:hypothetical protein
MADYETDIVHVVWNNKLGSKITVSPDGDGLGLIEVRHSDHEESLVMTPEEARLVAEAMLACAEDIGPVGAEL